MGQTYAVRHLDVLDEHGHLLVRDKTLEVLPRLLSVVRKHLRVASVPEDTARGREQVLHESRLARELNLDGALSDASNSAATEVLLMLFNGLGGILQSVELDVSISGLASDTLHDDVNGLLSIVEDAGVAAENSNDLGTVGHKGNL